MQQIVDKAKVSKPTLYYYFAGKARLFQALVDEAHDERYSLMQAAASRARGLSDQLVEILTVLFEFLSENRELMRIAFATAFAAPGEVPAGLLYMHKCERNFEFIHSLMKKGVAEGSLDPKFQSRELAYGLYGQMNIHVITHLLRPDYHLNRETAERIIGLFLTGAAAKKTRS